MLMPLQLTLVPNYIVAKWLGLGMGRILSCEQISFSHSKCRSHCLFQKHRKNSSHATMKLVSQAKFQA